mgnify:CR=1 FL=1
MPNQLNDYKDVSVFLNGKSEHTLMLFDHFIKQFEKVGAITIEPTKTMIGISNAHKRIAWVTQLGKNFIHIVFPFKQCKDIRTYETNQSIREFHKLIINMLVKECFCNDRRSFPNSTYRIYTILPGNRPWCGPVIQLHVRRAFHVINDSVYTTGNSVQLLMYIH